MEFKTFLQGKKEIQKSCSYLSSSDFSNNISFTDLPKEKGKTSYTFFKNFVYETFYNGKRKIKIAAFNSS